MGFPEAPKEILPEPSHFLIHGATIIVEKLDHSGWAMGRLSNDHGLPLPVKLKGTKTFSGHTETDANVYVATEPFRIWWPRRDTHSSRLAGTELLSYPCFTKRIYYGRRKRRE